MKKIKNVLLITCLGTLSLKMVAQQKNNSNADAKSGGIDDKMLIGKWRSDTDKRYVLVCNNSKYLIEYYDNEVVDTTYFKLSRSCDIADTTKMLTLSNAYLILGNSMQSMDQCNEILNLNRTTLSYRNNDTGKLHVFTRLPK